MTKRAKRRTKSIVALAMTAMSLATMPAAAGTLLIVDRSVVGGFAPEGAAVPPLVSGEPRRTLLAQYHFNPDQLISPYVGVGMSYTSFSNIDHPLELSAMHENSVGAAVQAGFDARLGERWQFNADVKRLRLASIVGSSADAIKSGGNIDHWLVGAGIRYRF